MKGRLQVHTGFLQSIQGKLTWGHSSALNASTPLTICHFEKFLSILCPGFVSDVTFKYDLITSGFTAEINHKFSLRVQVVKNVHNKNLCILKWRAVLKFKQIFGIDDFNSSPVFFSRIFPLQQYSFVAFLSELSHFLSVSLTSYIVMVSKERLDWMFLRGQWMAQPTYEKLCWN